MDLERTYPAMLDLFVLFDWTTGEAFGLPDHRVHERKGMPAVKFVRRPSVGASSRKAQGGNPTVYTR